MAKKWKENDSHGKDCAMRVTRAAECTCGKLDALTAEHTPGPWEVGGPDDAYIFAGSGSKQKRIAEIIEDELDSEFDYCSTEEANANAQLMAAAPEMLAALEKLVGWAQYMGGWDALVWKDAREAISKAKGE
jgi:hypothetical protein